MTPHSDCRRRGERSLTEVPVEAISEALARRRAVLWGPPRSRPSPRPPTGLLKALDALLVPDVKRCSASAALAASTAAPRSGSCTFCARPDLQHESGRPLEGSPHPEPRARRRSEGRPRSRSAGFRPFPGRRRPRWSVPRGSSPCSTTPPLFSSPAGRDRPMAWGAADRGEGREVGWGFIYNVTDVTALL